VPSGQVWGGQDAPPIERKRTEDLAEQMIGVCGMLYYLAVEDGIEVVVVV
jgi:hypothetical protein